eukprot:Gb_29072 [translate_table: standard]
MVGNTVGVNALIVAKLVCVLMTALGVSAVEYTVGDKAGWIVGPVNYTTWAAPKQFHVGDTLVFLYNKQFHNVLQVTKQNYGSCTSAKPLASYEDGNTSVILKKTARYYFICGFPGHCVAGQKFEITALAAAGPYPAPAVLPHTLSSPLSSTDMSPKKGIAPPKSHAHSLVSAGTVFWAVGGAFWALFLLF